VGPLEPLDEAGLTALKAESTAAALAYLTRFAAEDGVLLNSATGQWVSCRDEGSDFGEYTINALITVPAGEPENQLEPFILKMQADGWNTRRDSLPSRKSPTTGNAVVTFSKGNQGMRVVTTGGTDGIVIYSGACANSADFNNEGFSFADSDTIPVK